MGQNFPPGGKQLYVRRITLKRKGEEDIILVTNLLDAEQYPAAGLLDVYRLRWGIERVFQQVTEVFHLQHAPRRVLSMLVLPAVV